MQVKPRAHLTGDERATLGQTLAGEYAAGATVRQIASVRGISFGRAYRLLREAGCQMGPRGRRKQPKPDAVT